MAKTFSTESIGAVGIVIRILFFGIFIIFGYCRALLPVAGYNYGASEFQRLREASKFSIIVLSCFSLIFGIIMTAGAYSILKFFSSDAVLIESGGRILRYAGLVFPFFGFEAVIMTLHQALGKPYPAAVLSLARQGVLIIPIALLLYPFLGVKGIVVSIFISEVLILALSLFFGFRLKNQLSR